MVKTITKPAYPEFMSASAKDRDKIRQIFRFLQELHQVKSPPLVDIAQYEWKIDYDAVPRYASVQRGDASSGFVLKVARPAESHCPKPSIAIEKWLKPGWEQLGVEPELHPRRKTAKVNGEDAAELFEQSQERVEAFEKWYEQKRVWERSEEPLRDALNVFMDLFDLYGKFERESETLQLFMADGILRLKKQDVLIHHPILLQRVELLFNPAVPEFLIKESDEAPELYTPLLRYVGIDGKGIQQLREQIARESLHPLDAQATSEFFKSFIHKYWPDGLYGESLAQIPSDDVPCIYRAPLFFLGYRGQGYVEALESYIENLPGLETVPEALLRLVGKEDSPAKKGVQDAAAGPASIDLLLTKHANPEQRRVVKDQVAPSLRPLCVSVIHGDEDSSKELEESISGIINYLAKTSVAKLDKEIRELESERMELMKESADLRQKLREAALLEYGRMELHGEKMLPAECARRIAAEREQHGWIPGPVSEAAKCPLSESAIKKLYRINSDLTGEDKALLAGALPSLEQLPSTKQFISYFDQFKALDKKIPEESKGYWERDAVSVVALERLKHHLADALEGLEPDAPWFVACLQAGGEKGDRAETWLELIERGRRSPRRKSSSFAWALPSDRRSRCRIRSGSCRRSSSI
jgi:hypothetical protein